MVTNIIELEKAMQTIKEEVTQFWGSLVQDEQLHQLKVQLGEVEVQLEALRGLLKMIPPLAQLTKA